MKLARRQCLVGGAAALAGGAMRVGATGLAGVAGLGALSACTRRDDSRLPADVQGAWVGTQVERGHALRDGRWADAARLKAQSGEPVRVHTLVIGAGVAGLSAARVLMQAGLDDFAVLDMEDEMGGNARAHRMQGLPCPLGAHYLPVPGPGDAPDMAQWLEEIGVIRRAHGRWVGDERHLCHSPQERVFVPEAPTDAPLEAPCVWWPGQWHEGLMPHAATGPDDEAQFQRFHADVARARKDLGFAMPTTQAPWHSGHAALDALTFTQWLDQRGYTSPVLRWWADYACRDDYGAGAGRVSAWAGLHYFASRQGVGDDEGEGEPLLTWPQGNAWLIEQLAHGLGSRWQAGQVALRIEAGRHDVQVRSWSPARQQARHWVARQLILAVPLFIAQRLLATPLAPLQAVMPHMAYAPWLVSNLLIDTPFQDRSGAALSWDNVAYTSRGIGQGSLDLSGVPSLGYVNARQQSLAPPAGPMLLTHYWAFGGQHAAQGRALRQALLQSGADWRPWADRVAADLARIHPELPGRVQRIDLMRYGHAMSIPVPGLRGHAGLAVLCTPQGQGRLHFAHSDLSAYSVFEEAFTHGVRAANQVLSAVGMQRRMA